MVILFAGVLAVSEALSFSQALLLARDAPAQQTSEEVARARSTLVEHVPRLTENPILQVQPGARAMHTGGQGAEVYVSAAQPFLLSQLGKKRRAALEREHAADLAHTARTQRELRRMVAEAWLARWTAQRAQASAQSERELARGLAERMRAVFEAQEATTVELAAIRTWEAEAALLALSAEGDAFAWGMQLARALGRALEAPQPVLEDLPDIDLPPEPALAAELSSVEGLPEVRSAHADAAVSAARLVEVEATRGTRMAVGVLGWREGGGDRAAVATLEVQPPLFERGQREQATLRAERARAQGAEHEARVAARAGRSLLLHELEHTREVLAATEGGLLKAAEQLADAQQQRLEAREATAQDWVIARRSVLRAQLDTLRARAAHVLARFLIAEVRAVQEPR